MNFKYVYLLPVKQDPNNVAHYEEYYINLDDVNSAVCEFVKKYKMKPDAITMYHEQLSRLFPHSMHSSDLLRYLDDGTILMKTYLGYIALYPDFHDVTLTSSNDSYILVENKEAQQADKILLDEDEDTTDR